MELIGYLAATFTTISFLPQVIKVYKSKSTGDLSLSMFSIFTLGVFLWLVYGVYNNDYPLMVANSITMVLSLYLLVCKLVYK